FDVASNAAETFKELMTRHKSTVVYAICIDDSFFLLWINCFFGEFNSKLLESSNYMTRRHAAVKLLHDEKTREKTKIIIPLQSPPSSSFLQRRNPQESHKSIRIDAFNVFKV
ncbi:hypothetical protein M569_05907, partial [Genlisea aurea]